MKNNEDDIIELTGDAGDVLRFYHVGTIEYKEEWYVFFQPAEPAEGVDPDEFVIFKIGKEGEEEVLLPVEDDDILDEVYDEFMRELEDGEEGEAQGCDRDCGRCKGCDKK